MPQALAHRKPLVLVALVGAALLALAVGAQRAQAAPQLCPFTFQVLHDDKIGNLQLPKGKYRIRTSNATKLPCEQASKRFTQFLEDYDGVLPKPWRYTVVGVGDGRFIRAAGAVRFRIRRISGGGGGGGGGNHRHPDSGRRCPGTFTVLHNDRIGRLRLPRGPYSITLLQLNKLSCSQASSLFTSFLNDVDGVLPKPWVLYPQSGSFRRGAKGPGFRVKQL